MAVLTKVETHQTGTGIAEEFSLVSKISEIGSGNSTLMAMNAIRKNKEENAEYSCDHICIEPYEQPWLEKTGVTILRRRVEDLETSFFSELGEDDILFIDSSHRYLYPPSLGNGHHRHTKP